LVPEIYFSRIPVGTADEAEAVIDKILAYEENPSKEDYVCKMLYCGSKLNDETSTHELHQDVYNNHIGKYWDVPFYYLDDEQSYLPSGITGKITSSLLKNEIDNGFHILFETSHGNETLWEIKSGSNYYNTTHASSQTNAPASIILTSACQTNAFQKTFKCLSESFILNPDGGALAYLGSSHYGWYRSKQTNAYHSPSASFNTKVLEQIFDPSLDNYNWAKAVAMGKIANISMCTQNNSYRWLQMSLNPLGDAEMPIYTTDPQTFDNVMFSITSPNAININTGGVECDIIVYPNTSNTDMIKEFKNKRSITLNNLSSSFYITLVKHNYIPYRKFIVNSLFNGISEKNLTIQKKANYVYVFYGGTSIAPMSWSLTLLNPSAATGVKFVKGEAGEEIKMDVSDVFSGVYVISIQVGNVTYSKQVKI